jgi:hypothetical protein
MKPSRFTEEQIITILRDQDEPPRVRRRLFRLSHAASFCSLSLA